MATPVEISVVVEWENALLAADDRCVFALRQVFRQLGEIDRSAEVIVLFNPEQILRSTIEEALRVHLGLDPDQVPVDLRLEEAKGKHYYDLKNVGAARARGEVVVFIDSDVVPEEGWLEEMVRPFFHRPEVDVVAGHTYLIHESLLEKAFALGWVFPLRASEDTFHSNGSHFFANNVAFRRSVLQEYPFPEMPAGMSRGACVQLAQTLVSSGIPIWTNTAARAHHPPPPGLRGYVKRGMADGRDKMLRLKARGRPAPARFAETLLWCVKRVGYAGLRMVREGRDVDLAWWQAPVALFTVAGFYALAFWGSCTTLLLPRHVSRA